MMRLSMILWIVLTAAIGTALFHIKHVVQEMDDELARLNRAIAQEHRDTHVLRAEWNYHNQPRLLQELAHRHLDLQPMKPGQMARLGDLPRRDPAPSQGPGAPLATGQTPRPGARPGDASAAPRAVAAASLPAQRGPR